MTTINSAQLSVLITPTNQKEGKPKFFTFFLKKKGKKGEREKKRKITGKCLWWWLLPVWGTGRLGPKGRILRGRSPTFSTYAASLVVFWGGLSLYYDPIPTLSWLQKRVCCWWLCCLVIVVVYHSRGSSLFWTRTLPGCQLSWPASQLLARLH